MTPGWRTSEFWLALIGQLIAAVTSSSSSPAAQIAGAAAAAAIAAAYGGARSVVKRAPRAQLPPPLPPLPPVPLEDALGRPRSVVSSAGPGEAPSP